MTMNYVVNNSTAADPNAPPETEVELDPEYGMNDMDLNEPKFGNDNDEDHEDEDEEPIVPNHSAASFFSKNRCKLILVGFTAVVVFFATAATAGARASFVASRNESQAAIDSRSRSGKSCKSSRSSSRSSPRSKSSKCSSSSSRRILAEDED
jgi:hypothetical protein